MPTSYCHHVIGQSLNIAIFFIVIGIPTQRRQNISTMTSIFTAFDQSEEIEEFIKKIAIAIQNQGVVHGLGSVKKVLCPNGLERKELRSYVESEDGVQAKT